MEALKAILDVKSFDDEDIDMYAKLDQIIKLATTYKNELKEKVIKKVKDKGTFKNVNTGIQIIYTKGSKRRYTNNKMILEDLTRKFKLPALDVKKVIEDNTEYRETAEMIKVINLNKGD